MRIFESSTLRYFCHCPLESDLHLMICSSPQTPPPVFSNKESLMNAGNVAVSFSYSKIVTWSLLVKRRKWKSLFGNVGFFCSEDSKEQHRGFRSLI